MWHTPKAAIAHAVIGRSFLLHPSPILVLRGNPATTAIRNVVLGPLGKRSPLVGLNDVIRSREVAFAYRPTAGTLTPILSPALLTGAQLGSGHLRPPWAARLQPLLRLPVILFFFFGARGNAYPKEGKIGQKRATGKAEKCMHLMRWAPFLPTLPILWASPPLCIFFSRHKTDKRTPSLVPCARCCRCQYGSRQLRAPECGPLLHTIGKDRNASAIVPFSFAHPSRPFLPLTRDAIFSCVRAGDPRHAMIPPVSFCVRNGSSNSFLSLAVPSPTI